VSLARLLSLPPQVPGGLFQPQGQGRALRQAHKSLPDVARRVAASDLSRYSVGVARRGVL